MRLLQSLHAHHPFYQKDRALSKSDSTIYGHAFVTNGLKKSKDETGGQTMYTFKICSSSYETWHVIEVRLHKTAVNKSK